MSDTEKRIEEIREINEVVPSSINKAWPKPSTANLYELLRMGVPFLLTELDRARAENERLRGVVKIAMTSFLNCGCNHVPAYTACKQALSQKGE